MLAYIGSFRRILALYIMSFILAGIVAYPLIISEPVPEAGEKPSTAGLFFVYIIVATLFFLGIIIFAPWILTYILALLEIFFLFATTSFLVLLYGLPPTLPLLAVVARIVWWRSETARNVAALIIVSVSAAVVGSMLSPTVSVILLAILAVYDYISVFVTKHMVVLAKALGAKERGSGEKHLLGAGDVAIPAILAVSMMRISPAIFLLSSIGAILGLIFTTYLVKRWKRVLPALPSIGASQLLFTLVGLVITLYL